MRQTWNMDSNYQTTDCGGMEGWRDGVPESLRFRDFAPLKMEKYLPDVDVGDGGEE